MNNQDTNQFNTLMPVLFVGHGNPMNAIQQNISTKNWRKLSVIEPKPKAILCISSHWETQGIYITAMKKPKTIHDFGQHFAELYKVSYPAPGNPELASYIAEKLKKYNVKLDKQEWGLDHGSWAVLLKMYPSANIPVLQMSINTSFTLKQHYQFAKQLKCLRRQGVLILGSGNVVHHLGLLSWDDPNAKYAWAEKVRQKVNSLVLSKQHQKLIKIKQNGQQFLKAINSQQHYIPLLYCLALQQQKDKVTIFNDGFDMGSLSMTSYIIADKDNLIHQKLSQ